MLYKTFKEKQLSALGYGCMRLPSKGEGRDAPVDVEETRRCLIAAYENGVNYFDSAYGYHGGQSEIIMGKILKEFDRDTINIATKYPGHMGHTSNVSGVFAEQLEKTQAGHFDFYLLHNVNDTSLSVYTSQEYRIVETLLKEKEAGKIRHFGFSCHARPENLEKFLDTYPGVFEFCQIQLNYLDWILQNGKEKVKILSDHNIPVWVMEPVRGGKLARLPEADEAVLKAARPDDSIASWGFRWVNDIPEVTMILSGMSSYDQVMDNVKTFSSQKPLSESEKELLEGIAVKMLDMIPCTACRYCCDGCPQELDIPELLSMYNEFRFEPSFSVGMSIAAMPDERKPSACIACGQCKEACPQNIDVPAAMEAFSGLLANMGRRP